MILLMLIGILVMAVGRLRLTRSLVLVGRRARWYGLTLFLTAIPFTLIVATINAAIMPASALVHPAWRRVINYGLVIAYLVLLALPFRERAKDEKNKPPTITA